MSEASEDRGILLKISTDIARLEGKVDAIGQRLSGIDKRLDDHETRIRKVEAADMVTADDLLERDLEARKARRWIVGIAITIGLGLIAEIVAVCIAIFN